MKYIEEIHKDYIKKVIEERHIPVTESGCWIWTASATSVGYGDFRAFGKHYTAHAASYMAYNGSIDDNLHVMHKCDVRLCCNPNHLILGTNLDNILDSMKKDRRKGVTRKRPKNLNYKKTPIEIKKKAYEYMLQNKVSYLVAGKIFDIPSSTLKDYINFINETA